MKLPLTILLATLACVQFTSSYRILGVFPMNGKSHYATAERLMTGLAEKGHQVDVISHFPQKKPVPNFTHISIEGTLPKVINNISSTELLEISGQNFDFVMNKLGDRVCDLMRLPKFQTLIKNPPKDPPYDLVIVEVFFANCYLALGRHFNVPMVGLMTSSFFDWVSDVTGNPYNTAYTPGTMSIYEPRMNFWERLMNTVTTNIVTMKIRGHMARQDQYVKKYIGIDESIDNLHKDLALILVNSHHSMNGVKSMPTGVVEIGGMHVRDTDAPLSPEVQKWLDESTHGCVFFTFGSMVQIESFPKPFVETLYKSFENVAPVRVLMKVAHKDQLLPGLPKNVMTQSWFPQVSIFKHKNTKAFVTHGGLLSNQEAIYYGIPMIGIPLFGDQHTNLKTAERKKVIVNLGHLNNVTVDTLTNAIKTVLYDETYRANVKKISELFRDRPMPALDTAIYWVEYVARHGNILQSPAIHLTWLQQNLLDVYAFILACVAAVLFVVIVVLRKLKHWIIGCKSCSKTNKVSESRKKK